MNLRWYNQSRPVLVGTTTIEKSELLAALLTEYQLPYRLLNARPENIESESEIIAQAGCKNAITIATNMAGEVLTLFWVVIQNRVRCHAFKNLLVTLNR